MPENEGQKKSGLLQDMAQAESAIQLALALPIGCVLGWAFGLWLDKHFHTDWISVVGLLLGAIAGFIQIFRVAQKFIQKGS